ncbi:MAG: GDSL-type esterase/lipase family protein [Bacteroidales bacterium]
MKGLDRSVSGPLFGLLFFALALSFPIGSFAGYPAYGTPRASARLSEYPSEAILPIAPHKAKYLSLQGMVLSSGNRVSPLLQLWRAKRKVSPLRGTLLLLPGRGDPLHRVGADLLSMVPFLNNRGFDVAMLQYSTGSDSAAQKVALSYLVQAYRLLLSRSGEFGLQTGSLTLMGFSADGQLAARAVMNLTPDQQPNHLLLFDPLYMDKIAANGVSPLVMPPFAPKSHLFVVCNPALASDAQSESSVKAIDEYVKTWKGFDGFATYHRLSTHNAANARMQRDSLLDLYIAAQKFGLDSQQNLSAPLSVSRPNSAAKAIEGSNRGRHAEKVALVAQNRYDLIFIGNSITHNLEKAQYQPVWNQFYAPRNALNLGYSGYRTENILWNIANGELEGQRPKVIVLEIGTNNVDEKNYPVRHTAGELAGGIEAIVMQLRQRCPDAKILVLRCFPGCYGGPNPTSHRAILEHASNRVSKLADGKHIFYCDVNHVFLNMDGSINRAAMPDWLHPSPAATKAWAQAMEPLLSQLMGDKNLDTGIPENSAIVPASKLENDSYDWWARHAEILRIKDSINPEIVLIGNSITHFWGGTAPAFVDANGNPRRPNGPKAWESVFGPYRVLNLGFGWDRTQNVLWRLDHGQLDGLHPRLVVIHIGTNNTSQTANARINTASEIVEGIAAICLRVRSKVPGATIVLMKVFPREASPTHSRRKLIEEINTELTRFAAQHHFPLLDVAPQMLAPDGTLSKEMAPDFCHPSEKGYAIWAELLRAYLP